MVLHARIDSAGAVDLLGEHQPCQLMGHGDAAHAELEGSGLQAVVDFGDGVTETLPLAQDHRCV